VNLESEVSGMSRHRAEVYGLTKLYASFLLPSFLFDGWPTPFGRLENVTKTRIGVAFPPIVGAPAKPLGPLFLVVGLPPPLRRDGTASQNMFLNIFFGRLSH
jgi:hypothetical protein